MTGISQSSASFLRYNDRSTRCFSRIDPTELRSLFGSAFFEFYALDLVRRLDVTACDAVLEVACGTGILTHHLCTKPPEAARLVATDLNGAMFACAATDFATGLVRGNPIVAAIEESGRVDDVETVVGAVAKKSVSISVRNRSKARCKLSSGVRCDSRFRRRLERAIERRSDWWIVRYDVS
jgi:SAM-dependent methyltransferase